MKRGGGCWWGAFEENKTQAAVTDNPLCREMGTKVEEWIRSLWLELDKG